MAEDLLGPTDGFDLECDTSLYSANAQIASCSRKLTLRCRNQQVCHFLNSLEMNPAGVHLLAEHHHQIQIAPPNTSPLYRVLSWNKGAAA